MCRWFAYISPEEPCLLSDVLINPANSISKQCSEHYLPKLLPHGEETELDDAPDKLLRMRNSLLNMDGLGIAWYTNAAENYQKSISGPRPALYKSQSPPINDFNFRSLCGNTESKCVFAHIRATSGSVVTQVNSHPFVFGRHTFMHNGVVSNFSDIRRNLTNMMSYDAYCNVFGTTDSEHVAALYMTNLTGGHDNATKDAWEKEYPIDAMLKALIATIVEILTLQHNHLGAKAAPNSLNLCTTDGEKIVAIRFRNHEVQQPPSLYWSEFAGRTLNRKYPGDPDAAHVENHEATKEKDEHGKHTIVASEPTTHDETEWNLIGRNCALLVDEFGTETEVPILYDAKLNAIDPTAA
ncbi:N-terminal nucleophile aminohydrolase [Lepidopterella palustris CBS 459.81]|uniref:N-terminal nucleophile aminohydrolase n=1 Tax=Lepidopterella palustris CBS 459.81 TaxID=1314670 RepID=A0A8E2JE37_9PEZI|nr:N-terminal nucleophile aminohydrolase [Lepidopterella palustris CBS 459.81]